MATTVLVIFPVLFILFLAGAIFFVQSLFRTTPPRKWEISIVSKLFFLGFVVLFAISPETKRQMIGENSLLDRLSFLPFDMVSISWCISAIGFQALLLNRSDALSAPAGKWREAFAGTWLLLASMVVVVADSVWLQWGAMVVSGWLLCLILARNDRDESASSGAGTYLVWLTVGDFLWLVGLVLLNHVWLAPGMSTLLTFQHEPNLSPEQYNLSVTSFLFLVVTLVMRCGLFPLMVWGRQVAISWRNVAWVSVFGVGLSGALFLRWGVIFSQFEPIQMLLSGIGAMSVGLLGMMALVCQRDEHVDGGPRRLLTVVSIQWGIVFLGCIVLQPAIALSPIVNLLGLSATFLVGILCFEIDAMHLEPAKRSVGRFLLLFAGAVCCGILGQDQLADIVTKVAWPEGLNAWVMFGLVLVGSLFTTVALFREIQTQLATNFGDRDHAEADLTGTAQGTRSGGILAWYCVVLVLIVAPAVAFVVGQGLLWRHFSLAVPVVMAIGIVVARTWPDQLGGATPLNESGSLIQRLTSAEFYAPKLIRFFVAAPVRLFAHLCKAFDWYLLTAFPHKLPTEFVRTVAESSTLVDEETSESIAVWQLLAALLCLLAGVFIASSI
ncbi:hypothetical protein [Planctomicrobium sp. SH527]|uniref:hypothetical protein n=1 Tax=Planctomicrobium sp. SH527 TaxID=3448123 RepID=UPI003F5B9BD5